MQLSYPLRRPNLDSEAVMTRRGWWLVLFNFLLPGSAQILAGNRRLGRLGLCATFIMWLGLITAIVLSLLFHNVLFWLTTQNIPMLIVQIFIGLYAILWIVLTVNALRLVRLVRVRHFARLGIAAFSVLALVLSVGGAAWSIHTIGVGRDLLGGIFRGTQMADPVDGRYNIMLLGGDAGADREGMRPDSISVISVDANTGKTVTIGLPRDMPDIPFPSDSPMYKRYPNGYKKCDVTPCHLNSISTEANLRHSDYYPDAKKEGSTPGIEATKDAVEGITHLKIQYYVLIEMAGFAKLIDALGGVDVNVTERVPIGACHTDSGRPIKITHWIEPGKQHLDGNTALWYARARCYTSDYARMQRQQQLQDAMLKQFTPQNVLTKFDQISEAGQQIVETDVPQGMLPGFADLAEKTRKLPVTRVNLTPSDTFNPEKPDWDAARTLIDAALKQATASPSAG